MGTYSAGCPPIFKGGAVYRPLPHFLNLMNKRLLGLCTAGSVIALLFLWQQVQATRLGYEVSRSRIELNKKRDRTAYLRMELEQLLAPDLLAARAKSRLGMSPPNPERILFLGSTVPRDLSDSRALVQSSEREIGPIASLMGR